MNYRRFFNQTSLSRQPSMIRELTEIISSCPPSLISMATGLPNPDLFPIKEASLTLMDGSIVIINEKDMKSALQYSQTAGLPDFIDWVKHLQKDVHNPPTLGITDPHRQLDFLITPGSQDGLCKTFEACLCEGQNVLLETPVYSGTLCIVKPLRPSIIGIRNDGNGLDPMHLQEVLSQWGLNGASGDDCNAPKLLYLIPNGGNPTGTNLTLARKREIYRIAQSYDLLILEDDPYFFLQFDHPYVPSFLSMDEDGRVVRFDSFSKLLSGGARVGIMSGPRAVVERVKLHMQVSVLHTSGLAQMCLLTVLRSMGIDGFRRHALMVADFYRRQCDSCLASVAKHLSGLAEWTVPSGGMFLWIRLLNIQDSSELIMKKARDADVLFVPGNVFMIDESQPCPYIRASFSLVNPDLMDQVTSRFTDSITLLANTANDHYINDLQSGIPTTCLSPSAGGNPFYRRPIVDELSAMTTNLDTPGRHDNAGDV